MIIIIEGPDGTGKTTLAEYLSATTGYPIKHRSKPKDEQERQLMYDDYRNDIKSGKHMIWDRGFYSEMVYGPLMRDQSYISLKQMEEFEQLILTNGGLVIHCTGEPVELYKNATTRGETYITELHLMEKLVDSYEKLLHQHSHAIPVVRYTI